jgi:hypothetical protein
VLWLLTPVQWVFPFVVSNAKPADTDDAEAPSESLTLAHTPGIAPGDGGQVGFAGGTLWSHRPRFA